MQKCNKLNKQGMKKDMTHTTFTVLDADWLMSNWKLKGTRFSDFQKVET